MVPILLLATFLVTLVFILLLRFCPEKVDRIRPQASKAATRRALHGIDGKSLELKRLKPQTQVWRKITRRLSSFCPQLHLGSTSWSTRASLWMCPCRTLPSTPPTVTSPKTWRPHRLPRLAPHHSRPVSLPSCSPGSFLVRGCQNPLIWSTPCPPPSPCPPSPPCLSTGPVWTTGMWCCEF